METVFIAAWEAFEKLAEINTEFELENKKDEFVKKCTTLYDEFVDEHMQKTKFKEKQYLDRHKLGAIIAIVGSKGYIKSRNSIPSDKFFIGQYLVPVIVALQLVLDDTNKDLIDANLIKGNELIENLYIPEPKVCSTPYQVVLARTLFFEEDYGVNDLLRVIELANVFFLIEELTLIKEDIPMDKWLAFKRNQSAANS